MTANKTILSHMFNSSHVRIRRMRDNLPSNSVSTFLLLFILVLTYVGLPGCGEKEPVRIVILHTNDMHAQISPLPATWIPGDEKPLIGGFAALEAYISSEREGELPVLLLDAGDLMTGTPLSDIEVEGVEGGALLQILTQIGYEAATLGNHEFDDGQENVKGFFSLAGYSIVCANLFRDGELFAPVGYTVLDVSGLKVGVIGLLLEDFFGVVIKQNTTGLVVEPVVGVAQKMIDELDPLTDLIILLTHQGVEEDKRLAREISGADVIVGGHGHTRLEEPVLENGVIILQAGSKSRYLGRLEVLVQGDSVAEYSGRLIPVWVDSIEANPEFTGIIKSYELEIERVYGDTIAILLSAFTSSSREESNVGTWLSGVMRAAAGTDFALINSHGIRKFVVPAGPLTKRTVVEMLPFGNTICTFEVTGEQLLSIMQHNADVSASGRGEILQVSGISYEYKIDGDRAILSNPRIGGEPVDPTATYTGATNSFILFGQEMRYFGLIPGKKENSMIVFSDAVMEFAEKAGEIDAKILGSIRNLEP